ncbi:Uncharacterised protein [Mycobacterium tuberculosis]|nr:Uncharacterised protein [Mycobacterium tuberculosis]COX30560.1 Uncharacterised protein [Mycobacterium tuberculosis]
MNEERQSRGAISQVLGNRKWTERDSWPVPFERHRQGS